MRTLDIITAVSNPLLWKSRPDLARKSIASWLQEPNTRVTLVECAYGDRGYELGDLASDRVTHVPVRARTLLWNKENLLNIGLSRLPHNAKYVATLDSDITWRKPGWAMDTIHALDLYPVVQPWQYAYDLGPNDEHMAVHSGFASMARAGKPVVPRFDKKTLSLTNHPYQYPHPGYAWAWVIEFLNFVGGLFEWGGVGAGDHHMALALVKNAHNSLPHGVQGNYKNMLESWQTLAILYGGGRIGSIPHTIEHAFHGRKTDRGYNARWNMFVDHEFDPTTDTKRNIWGVLEFAGNKPALERAWDVYLRQRNEDINSLS